MNVPTYLIHTYKPHNSFGFYFFDDFYISNNTSKEITCHYINLYDKNSFKRFDIMKYPDSFKFTSYKSDYPFCDRSKFFDKPYHSVINDSSEMIYKHVKSDTGKVMQKTPKKTIEFPLAEDRNIKVPLDGNIVYSEIQQSTSSSRIYVPDSYKEAETRFNLNSELMKDRIERLCLFEMLNSFPDYPQFGVIYNLDKDAKSEYVYTPYNICNVFTRKNVKEEFLSHSAKCVMIRYKGD